MKKYCYMQKKIILMLCIAGLFICSGCDLEQTSQETPKDALRKFIDGYLRLNKAKVLSSVTGSKTEIEALSVYMDYMIAVRKFKKAVVSKYGSSGWAYFEKDGGAKLSLNLTPNRINLETAMIELKGKRATCAFPDESITLKLYLKNGFWYVGAKDVLETEGMSLKKFITMWKGITNVIKANQTKIGQPGVTAQSLDVEMGAELSAVLIKNR